MTATPRAKLKFGMDDNIIAQGKFGTNAALGYRFEISYLF